MGKLTLFFFLFSFRIFAFEQFFQNEVFDLEIHENNLFKNVHEYVKPPNKNPFLNILSDPENRVFPDFKINSYFKSSASFWFDIYSLYGKSQVVIHDRFDPSIQYEVLDFSSAPSKINPFTLANFRKKLIESRFLFYKKTLFELASNPEKSKLELLPHSVRFQISNLDPASEEYNSFLTEIAFSLRTQTGLRDAISKGMKQFSDYENILSSIINRQDLPDDILAIPFIESSFNLDAISKVSASGIWQLMPSIAKSYFPDSHSTNFTSEPILSTVAATHLVKHNLKALGTWDLTIAAYNSGASHLRKSLTLLNKKVAPLETILQSYKHPHIGFASTNFYSEFLAMVYILNYRDTIFKESISAQKMGSSLHFYLSLCAFTPATYFQKHNLSEVLKMNRHLTRASNNYPRGTIIISSKELDLKRFYLVSEHDSLKRIPKKWSIPKKISSKLSCSD